MFCCKRLLTIRYTLVFTSWYYIHELYGQQLPANLVPSDNKPLASYTISYEDKYPKIVDPIKELVDAYAGMPEHCTYDDCSEYVDNDERKGLLDWPRTTVGKTRFLLCPYAYFSPIYAQNDCVLADNNTLIWIATNFSGCPDPPLALYLQSLGPNIHATAWQWANVPKNALFGWYTAVLSNLVYIITNYAKAKTFADDGSDVATLCDNAIIVLSNYSLPTSMVSDAMTLMEYVSAPTRLLGDMKNIDSVSRARLLRITAMATAACNETIEVRRDGIYSYHGFIDKSAFGSIYIPSLFTNVSSNAKESSINLTLFRTADSDTAKESKYEVTVTAMRTGYLLLTNLQVDSAGVKNRRSIVDRNALAEEYQRLNTLAALSKISRQRQKESLFTPAVTQHLQITSNLPAVNHNFTLSKKQILKKRDVVGSRPNAADALLQTFSPSNLDVGGNRITFISITGPIVFINTQPLTRVSANITLTYGIDIGDDTSICADIVCGQIETTNFRCIDNLQSSHWSTSSCQTIGRKTNRITCLCSSTGFVAALCKGGLDVSGSTGPTKLQPVSPPPSTLEQFLGFPYNYQLYIFSHVTRALSLACFMATVLSYAIFRNARRGQPTVLLLNLCVALMALLVLLYISEWIPGGIVQCKVLNVLRYYLIFVSLLWNAAEAVTMYIMFVKVFDSHISYFAFKAGSVAWGVPMLLVAINYIIDKESFDGRYFDCTFVCALPTKTLIYGYLIPLILIIGHNLIMFALILPNICRRRNHVTADSNIDIKMQLIGAMGLLFLLGTPWIFSAFGALATVNPSDGSLSVADGILETLFILFVNAQGIYIFLFHCARNGEMRAGWRRMWRDAWGNSSQSTGEIQLSQRSDESSHMSSSMRTRQSIGSLTASKRKPSVNSARGSLAKL